MAHQDESDLIAETLSEIIRKDTKAKRPYRLKKPVRLTLAALAGALVMAGVLLLLVPLQSPVTPLKKSLQKQQSSVSHKLFAPSELPASYTTAEADTINSGGVIFTTLHSQDNSRPKIVISQQAVPAGIGVENLLGLVPPKAIDVPAGKLYIASTETAITGVLVTEVSWIIISSEKSLSSDTLTELAQNFSP